MELSPYHLHLLDQLALRKLWTLGPKTKFQLLSLGLKPFMIDKLETLGILVREYNNQVGLNYYVIRDGFFDG